MNDLKVFNNPEFGQIRTLMIEDAPWAVGKDVATALGYGNPQKALRDHVDPDDILMGERNVTPSVTDKLGRPQFPAWINESGLFSLILSSKLPSAKRFKHWVTSEVLPALRRSGKYEIATQDDPAPPVAEQRKITPDDYLRAASIVGSCRNERLPIVLNMLAQGGFTVPVLGSIDSLSSGKDIHGKAAIAINHAVNDYGISMTMIGKLTGLPTATITRIRSGSQKPTTQRAALICDAIKREIERRAVAAK